MSEFVSHPQWYALHTRSNFERLVTQELLGKGLESYCPGLAEPQCAGRPLFRGYVFVRFADAPQTRLEALKSRGAVKLLGTGARPEAIPDQQVEALRQLLASERQCRPHPFLQRGARVRIQNGPLSGIEGRIVRFKKQTRIVLNVDLLAQAVAAEVDQTEVEIIGSHSTKRA